MIFYVGCNLTRHVSLRMIIKREHQYDYTCGHMTKGVGIRPKWPNGSNGFKGPRGPMGPMGQGTLLRVWTEI